ncbi:MAG TPA: hypothetical protein VKJ00_13940, partial [Thermoanaerobaculia bacterium]|nr:hypothetical protein [Thermoanaerobaculia bacterium]
RWAAIEMLFRTEYRRLGFGKRRVGWKRAGSPDAPEAAPKAHSRNTPQALLFDGAEEDPGPRL